MVAKTLLIDSHVLLWFIYEPQLLSEQALSAIKKADTVYISAVSFWELAIKYSKRKLEYSPADLIKGAALHSLTRLGLDDIHIAAYSDIELPQADPYDTMLVAQSEVENCTLLTADKQLLQSRYRTLAAS